MKWTPSKAKSLQAIARQLFKCDQNADHDKYRESCGACALKGYLSKTAIADGFKPEDGPNYAGWARIYVQAGRPIPKKWKIAFAAEKASDNFLYREALENDIATFGVSFE